jgi:predicted permease
MLLVGAGLFVRSLGNLNALETGFRRERTLIVDLDPTRNGYTIQRARDYYERLRQNVEGIPGVRSAALARIIPLAGGRWNQFVTIPGYDYKQGERKVIDMNAVTPRFFETLGIPIVAGRDFRTEDSPAFTPAPPTRPPPPDGALRPEEIAGPHVAIVNESLVKKYFAGRSPVGARLALTERYREEGSYEIVGVVKDVRYFGLRQPTEPMVYVPAWRAGSGSTALCIRTGAGAETVIEAVRRQANTIDSAIPILRTRTMEQNVDSNILQEKLVATLAGFFGLLALLLAAVGLYGVMAHSVARRTREIGIRMALGAAGRAVLWMVLRDALVMVTVGAAIGIPAALALAKLASSLLFGIAAGDPFNAFVATLFLGGIAVVSSYLPARRASRIDPGIALRYQ